MNKKTLFNYFYHSSYKLLTMLLPIITIPIVARALGPTGIGLWNYVNSIVNYFYLIASLGLASYGVREIAKVRDDQETLSTMFWELQTFNMIFSGVTFLAYVTFSFFTDYPVYFLVQSVFIIGAFLDISWFFIGVEEFRNITIIKLVVKVAAFVSIVLFVRDSSDMMIYFWIQSSTHVIPELLYWGMIRNRINRVMFPMNIFRHIKPALAFVIPRVSTILNVTMSKTILGLFTTIELVGYYSTSLSLVILSGGLIMALNDVMLPRLSHMTNNSDDTRFIDVFSKSVHIQLFLSIPITFGIILISNTMVGWFYGDQFTYIKQIIPFLAPILITQSLQASLGIQYFIPKKLMKQYNTATLSGSILSLTLNLIFTQFYGIYAVIIGVSLGYLTMVGLMSRYLYKKTSFRYKYVQILKTVIAAVMMFVITGALTNNYPSTVMSTLFQIVIGGGIYLIVVTMLGGNPLYKGGKKVSTIKKNFDYLKSYGLTLYIYKVLVFLLGKRLRSSKKKNKLHSKILTILSLKKEKLIKDFLRENLTFPVSSSSYDKSSKASDKIIWQMWWQGIEDAPDIVQSCLNNTKKKNADKEVIIIDKDNIHEYLDIDEEIISKVDKKILPFAPFSDYVRFSLLSKYGGLWIDSTCYIKDNIDEQIFEYDFYTSKNVNANELTPIYPITARLQSFFVASLKGGDYVTSITSLLEQSIQKGYHTIDYLLTYYIMEILIEDDEQIKQSYSDIPENNKNILAVLNKLGGDDNSRVRELLEDENTHIFKLTYKIKNENSSNFCLVKEHIKQN